jgi:hypothetical protein
MQSVQSQMVDLAVDSSALGLALLLRGVIDTPLRGSVPFSIPP